MDCNDVIDLTNYDSDDQSIDNQPPATLTPSISSNGPNLQSLHNTTQPSPITNKSSAERTIGGITGITNNISCNRRQSVPNDELYKFLLPLYTKDEQLINKIYNIANSMNNLYELNRSCVLIDMLRDAGIPEIEYNPLINRLNNRDNIQHGVNTFKQSWTAELANPIKQVDSTNTNNYNRSPSVPQKNRVSSNDPTDLQSTGDPIPPTRSTKRHRKFSDRYSPTTYNKLDNTKSIKKYKKKSSTRPQSHSSDEYEVEAICDVMLYNGELRYLVKWDGYGESDNTWEPAVCYWKQ